MEKTKSISKSNLLYENRCPIICIALLMIIIMPVSGQNGQNKFAILLNNGKYMSVQACSDKIIRVRISSQNDFPESLMERYELIKTDWQKSDVKSSDKNNLLIMNTGAAILTIDKKNGTLSWKDKNGKILVDNITLNLTDQKPKYDEFVRSISALFEKEIITNEIIGGDTSSIEDNNIREKKRSAMEKQRDLLNPLSKAGIAEFSLNKTERFYGLGSAVRDRIQHRGTVARIWPQYEHSESPFPFIMSTDGWGVFFNTTRVNYFDIGSYQPDKMIVFCTDDALDFYLMAGSMPEILDQYTTITRKPYLLPKWAYGLAFGSNMMENEFNILEDALHFRQEYIPCDIYWIEPQWVEKFYDSSTKKSWDPIKFFEAGRNSWEKPITKRDVKPDLFINRLNNMGFKLALWLNNNEDLSIEEEDYLAAKQGKAQSGKEHWFLHLMKFVNEGVQGFKLDPGTTMDEHPERKYYNGLTDKEMHTVNQVLLPKQLYRLMKDSTGLRSFHHYCGGYAGQQHWTAATSGDNGGGHLALFDQLNLGISGFMNSSCDVLALDKNEPIEQGMHFGFFLPWVQINSWASILHPWFLSPKEKKEFQFYAQLRYSLIPYIYSTAISGSLTGMPILRAMPLIFPDDPRVENATTQFMFGDFFLVSVFSDKTYLPEGNWIDYWTGKKYRGNQEVISEKQIHGGPLFVKSGAIIPFQKPMQFVDEKPADTLLLKVFPEKNSSYILFEDDGSTFDYEKGAIAKTTFKCQDDGKSIRLYISKRDGKYKNMPQHRVYKVEVFCDESMAMIVNNLPLQKENIEFDKKMNALKFYLCTE
jgi:alpha-glucosidase (family GH31 glycosyl hydrolase)